MVFSNLVFLFAFLPLVLLLYFGAKQKFRNFILLVASLVFYAWGEPQYIFLMLFSVLLNYLLGLGIHYYREELAFKKAVLTAAVIINLVLLGYYKYSSFLLANLNNLLGTQWSVGDLPLPIGISFFTFQAMSYVIDVYRNDAKVQRNIFSLALYVAFFPQLVAGPIVRYNDVEEQIQARTIDLEKFSYGVKRFIIGLAKKVLLANGFATIADGIFNSPTAEMSVLTAWTGIMAYTLQIYFDFSGYSDMAIGLGKMFGFDFLENFNYPYISKSVTEFWRRWHMSLGSWFRDYLYIPLGGNRKGNLVTLRNLLVVWTITGFWHGASWTFMAWGFYYGILISLERFGLSKLIGKIWAPLQHLYVILAVMIGWVFFRADNFPYSLEFLGTMFALKQAAFYDNTFLLYLHDNWYLFLLGFIFSTPLIPKINELGYWKLKPVRSLRLLIEPAVFMFLLAAVTLYLVSSSYNPFIYFRF